MNPIFAILAIAGAFVLGRKSVESDKAGPKGPRPSPIPLPLPSADDIDVPDLPDMPDLDLPASSSGPSQRQIMNAAAWNRLAFDAMLYPAGANKTLVPPPVTAAGITATADCSVIAVGERWWDRAGQIVKNMAAQNQLSVRNLERLLPARCQGSRGAAAVALRAELLERATKEYGPIRNPRGGHRGRRRGGARWWMR